MQCDYITKLGKLGFHEQICIYKDFYCQDYCDFKGHLFTFLQHVMEKGCFFITTDRLLKTEPDVQTKSDFNITISDLCLSQCYSGSVKITL